MPRRLILIILLAALAGATMASADPARHPRPYLVRGSGLIVSFTNGFSTFTGTASGSPTGTTTVAGSESDSGMTPPCGSGAGNPSTGSSTGTAPDGDQLYSTFAGTVCTTSTGTATTYLFTGTFRITGGTGRFAGAGGHGRLVSRARTAPSPEGGYRGPLSFEDAGTIELR